METWEYCAPCLFGVEGILGDELRRLGADNVRPGNGRVLFSGPVSILARANICSRYAERIQILLGRFTARTFTQLFDGVRALPLEQFIGVKNAFPVKGWSLNSQLHSVPDCQSIVKKAAVERLREAYSTRFLNETDAKCQIQFTILRDEVTVLLDTSGKLLKDSLSAQPTMVKPNKDEIEALFGVEITCFDEVKQYAKKLYEMGIPYVAVSLGGDGAMLVCAEGIYQAKPPKVQVVNTVGCGDSMVGAFAAALAQKKAPQDALAYAAAVGTANALSSSTGDFDPAMLPRLLEEMTVTKL